MNARVVVEGADSKTLDLSMERVGGGTGCRNRSRWEPEPLDALLAGAGNARGDS
ncbi:MAG: hypothetical protein OXE17_06000 [Chloroflexi bacterium]|nr:hypothetical protein [Chloroflexota bacterium]